jgi:hypothetical protein
MKTSAAEKKIRFSLLQKISFTFVGLMLGFCQNIAAQYGVVVDYIIRGKVISMQTSEPIPGLQIQAYSGDDKVLSDSKGEFSISGQTMSNRENIYVKDIDCGKNRRWLPVDTICTNFDSAITIYVKEEPKIESFLKENPMFPTELNGKKLKYTEFVYVRTKNIEFEIKGNLDSKVYSKIFLNDSLISTVTATDSKTLIKTVLPQKTNCIILQSECGNSNNQSSKKIIIDDRYDKQTVNLRSGKSESEALILIYLK